jgi:hypothetical protein
MAWTTPRTWTTGDVATAAQFNVDMRDNFAYLRGAQGFLDQDPSWWNAKDFSLPAIAHASATAIANFDSIQSPWTAQPSSGTGIILPEPGVYLAAASCFWSINGVGAILLRLDGRLLEGGGGAWYGNNVNWHVTNNARRLIKIAAAPGGTISLNLQHRINGTPDASFIACTGARVG